MPQPPHPPGGLLPKRSLPGVCTPGCKGCVPLLCCGCCWNPPQPPQQPPPGPPAAAAAATRRGGEGGAGDRGEAARTLEALRRELAKREAELAAAELPAAEGDSLCHEDDISFTLSSAPRSAHRQLCDESVSTSSRRHREGESSHKSDRRADTHLEELEVEQDPEVQRLQEQLKEADAYVAELEERLRRSSPDQLLASGGGGGGGEAEQRALAMSCSIVRKHAALGDLRASLAQAEAEPRSLQHWRKLRKAIDKAEAAKVDEEHLEVATALVSKGQMWCTVQTANTREELLEAIRAVKQSDFSDTEIAQMEEVGNKRMETLEQVAESKRRLRIAVAWASTNNLDKLKRAIAEAESVGVDAEEIAKAEKEVADILSKESANTARSTAEANLRDVLRAAKPYWTSDNLEAALRKLAGINIVTMPGLREALASPEAESDLNERLRAIGQKAFAEDTLKAIKTVLDNR
mmetsp:Transcript_25057/g.62840  ORF Transcript_25057/g.62840 Transcript_25057/m.62840 type:complete len:464 (-) Transcript_25057:163-1554(-)